MKSSIERSGEGERREALERREERGERREKRSRERGGAHREEPKQTWAKAREYH